VVLADKDGVVKLLEVSAAALVCNTVPPVNAEYQVKVPTVALEAGKITVPAPQREAAVTVGAVGSGLIVAVTAVRGVLSQLAELLIVT
jgi:ribose 5-phosphate isomerase RpiB